MTLKKFMELFRCLETITAEKVLMILSIIMFGNETALDVYKRKTGTRKTAVAVGNTVLYVSDPASKGNTKIDKSCLTTKLLPFVTCPNCKKCWCSCYVKGGLFRWKAYFCYMLIYTYIAQNNVELYVELLANQIRRTKAKYVRLHESGDFFNDEYCQAMKKLFRMFPKVQFYTYTKTNFKFHCKNLNIVKSLLIWQGETIVNFGPKEVIDVIARELGIPVCPCGVKPVKCISSCKLCLTHDLVLFYEHSIKPVKWESEKKEAFYTILSEYMPFWNCEFLESNPEKAARIVSFYAKNELFNDPKNKRALKAVSALNELFK